MSSLNFGPVARGPIRIGLVIGWMVLAAGLVAWPVVAKSAAAEPDASPSAVAPSAPGEETRQAEAAEVGEAAEAIPPVPELQVRADELISEVEHDIGELDELRLSMARSRGEERLLAEDQVARKQIEILDSVRELAENLLEQREAEYETTALAERVDTWIHTITPALEDLVRTAEQDFAAESSGRDATPTEELLDLETAIAQRSARIDELYGWLSDHGDLLVKLGYDDARVAAFMVEHLGVRAKALAGRIEFTLKQREELNARSAEEPDNAVVKTKLAAVEQKLDWATRSLDQAAVLLDHYEVDTAEYRQLLIRSTGVITGEIFDTDVAFGLVEQAVDAVRTWIEDNGTTMAFRVVFFAIIVILARLIAIVMRAITRRGVQASRLNFSKLLRDMIVSIVGNVVIAIGILIGLSQLGVELGPLLAGIGIAGFVIGFALQDTLANFAAGAMILIYRPYDVGDMIEAATVFGEVSAMSLVSTKILTIDHQTLIVPNSKIWGDVIRNVTAQKRRRIDMKFYIAHSDDVELAERVFTEIISNHAKVLEDPQPMVHVHKLQLDGVEFVVRPWVETQDYWEVYWDVTREVKIRLEREGLHFPLPRREVHLRQDALGETGGEGDRR